MPTKTTIEETAAATLKRLEEKDRGLKQKLKKAYGYAVFPSVGKASLVVGGSYGRGAVFEQGKFIGHATISQLTIGVQIGGDTFSEILLFQNKQALDQLKHGKMAFAADASVVLVKAGAAAMKGFPSGVTAYAYSRGGMLLELVIGGQKFKFKPADEEEMGEQEQEEGEEQEQKGGRHKAAKGKGKAAASADEGEGEGDEQQDDEGQESEGEEAGVLGRAMGGVRTALGGAAGGIRSAVGGAAGGVKSAASRVTETAKAHPVAATVVGTALVAGVAVLVARSVRGGSGQSEEDGQDEQDENEAQGQADEGEEQEEQGEDEGDEKGDTLNQLRRRRSRA